jgi:small-conductance mechanosensitive channel
VLAQFKTRPLTQYEITRAFNIRLKRNFDANGIRLAVPFVTVQVDGSGTEEEIATAAAAGAGADLVTRKAGKPA